MHRLAKSMIRTPEDTYTRGRPFGIVPNRNLFMEIVMTNWLIIFARKNGGIDVLVAVEARIEKICDLKLMERVSQMSGCMHWLHMHLQDAVKLGETEARLLLFNVWHVSQPGLQGSTGRMSSPGGGSNCISGDTLRARSAPTGLRSQGNPSRPKDYCESSPCVVTPIMLTKLACKNCGASGCRSAGSLNVVVVRRRRADHPYRRRAEVGPGFEFAAGPGGLGAAYHLRCRVAKELEAGTLVALAPGIKLPRLSFNALHAFGRTVPLRVKLFCDFMVREAKVVENI
jgi:hypothetical protein